MEIHNEDNLNLHQNYKIMVVDDEAIYLVEFEDLLREHGYRVRAAVDGKACLEMAEDFRPDLILLDIAMPKLNGIEVLRQLKTNPAFKRLPIIVVSGKAAPTDLPKDCRDYVSDFFSKPFDINLLLDRIEKTLLFGAR